MWQCQATSACACAMYSFKYFIAVWYFISCLFQCSSMFTFVHFVYRKYFFIFQFIINFVVFRLSIVFVRGVQWLIFILFRMYEHRISVQFYLQVFFVCFSNNWYQLYIIRQESAAQLQDQKIKKNEPNITTFNFDINLISVFAS